MYLEGTGDEFVISTTDKQGIKSFLEARGLDEGLELLDLERGHVGGFVLHV